VTPQAVSIPVAVGKLEDQPRLSAEAYTELRRRNQERVSLPEQSRQDAMSAEQEAADGSEDEPQPTSRPPKSAPSLDVRSGGDGDWALPC
jgi:hypothetical protein